MADEATVRAELRRLASAGRTRTSEFTKECPTEWRPHTVLDPRSGNPFTDAGAWDYVVEQLDAGCAIGTVVLRKPPGKTGYVLKLPGHPGQPLIYVKLQLGSGRVIGRSFHDD